MSKILLLSCLNKSKVKHKRWKKKYKLYKISRFFIRRIPMWSRNSSYFNPKDINKLELKNLQNLVLLKWLFCLKNPFIFIHKNRQRIRKPVRFTMFENFLDDKLRFGGSYLINFYDTYALNIKRSTVIFKSLKTYRKKTLMFLHFLKKLCIKDYGIFFRNWSLLLFFNKILSFKHIKFLLLASNYLYFSNFDCKFYYFFRHNYLKGSFINQKLVVI